MQPAARTKATTAAGRRGLYARLAKSQNVPANSLVYRGDITVAWAARVPGALEARPRVGLEDLDQRCEIIVAQAPARGGGEDLAR
jgi:hypothetical protein